MEFTFTPEQRAVALLAQGLFESYGSDDHVRALAESATSFDAPLWRKLVETGLHRLILPESLGGSGMGMIELGLVLEQQGRRLAAAPLWQHLLAALAIEVHGTDELKARVLPELTEAQAIATLATELDDACGVTARSTGDGWALNGSLPTVLLDACQKWLLVPANTPQGPGIFLVPTDQPGMRRIDGRFTDFQPVCELGFCDARLPGDAALDPTAMSWLEPRIALCLAALQLGVVQEALARASAYVSERQQFGRALGSFQAIAVRAADAYIEVELLRSAQWQLAWRLDHGLPCVAAGRVAKYQASQAGHLVGHTAQHFHGGVGADLRYPIHRYFLKSRALEMTGGGAEAQLAHLGRALAGASIEAFEHE